MNQSDQVAGLVAEIRRSCTPKGRAGTGLYCIEGIRLHERALRAEAPLTATLVSQAILDDDVSRTSQLCRELAQLNKAVIVAPDSIMDELTAGRTFGQIISLVKLPQVRQLGALLGATSHPRPTLTVAVDIEDPGNVGAMVRTAAAANGAALIAAGVSDAWHPKAVRASMGSLFKLPCLAAADTTELIDRLKRLGVLCIAAVADGGEMLPLDHVGGQGPIAVFMGNEAAGLAPGVVKQMDLCVTIPMSTEIDSYSVNAATAIVLYEIGRVGLGG